jgi:hypothetical protein
VRVLEYRVTKYNPAFRDARGAFTRDEWTCFRDIGESFAGVTLNREEYERVERAYVNVALAFLSESGVSSLTVEGLENSRNTQLTISNGSVLPLEQIGDLTARVLREEFWCRLVGVEAFLHFGWDYYMYVGVLTPCPVAQALSASLGLFVEDFESPYRP